MKFEVAEIFQSINGEGRKAGELAVFVRMKGCNLKCAYCDTTWANEPDCAYRELSIEDILKQIEEHRVKNVTLTGGEPLCQPGVEQLIKAIVQNGYELEIETNGSVNLENYQQTEGAVSFTMDYKLDGSGMEQQMCMDNFALLQTKDTVKFVVSDAEDLKRAYEVWKTFLKKKKIPFLLSPVFGAIEPEEIVNFMKERHWVEACLQIQLHKVIWDPAARGV